MRNLLLVFLVVYKTNLKLILNLLSYFDPSQSKMATQVQLKERIYPLYIRE